ncbi:MAG: hypothetical protein DWI48_05225 [Chloroflexi bacterium]|nr:MAG: hypothetical protein DWI48_05225 [Chloroflexota bacterium]
MNRGRSIGLVVLVATIVALAAQLGSAVPRASADYPGQALISYVPTTPQCNMYTSFPGDTTLRADGVSTTAICILIRDANQHLAQQWPITVTVVQGTINGAKTASLTTNRDGMAVIVYTAPSVAGTEIVSIRYAGAVLPGAGGTYLTLTAVPTPVPTTAPTAVPVATPYPTPSPDGPYLLRVTFTPRQEWCSTLNWDGQIPYSVTLPADDSITQAVCVWLTGRGIPVIGQPVIVRSQVGVFGSGSTQAVITTDAKGRATTSYHGVGKIATTDTITVPAAAYALETTFPVTLTGDLAPTPTATATPAATAQPSTAGRIVGGAAPVAGGGFTLFVFGGGTNDQLVSASQCAAARGVFWVSASDGSFITLVPGAAVGAVNESWNARFTTGVPSNTPVIATCRAS